MNGQPTTNNRNNGNHHNGYHRTLRVDVHSSLRRAAFQRRGSKCPSRDDVYVRT